MNEIENIKSDSLITSDVLSNGYSRNSFDRFGDDLCEHILQYLSFVDKIRFQCVSNQFKRSVYGKQDVLKITNNLLNDRNSLPSNRLQCYVYKQLPFNRTTREEQTENVTRISILEQVLKMFTNITHISIELRGYNFIALNSDQLLCIIADNCCNLRSIEFQFIDQWLISKNTLKYFGEKTARTLQCISFGKINEENIPQIKQISLDLMRVSGINFSNFVKSERIYNRVFVPKLKELKHPIGFNKTELMDVFVSEHNNIKVFKCGIYVHNCNTLLSQISQLNKLEKLILYNKNVGKCADLAQFVSGMNGLAITGGKQLKYLHLYFQNCSTTAGLYIQLLTAINCFEKLKYLRINLSVIESNPKLTVELLKNCTQLRQLYFEFHLYSNQFITSFVNTFYADIRLYLPQLKRASIKQLTNVIEISHIV